MIRKKVQQFVLKRIEHASESEIHEMIRAMIRRYDRLFPEYEISFVSLHRNAPERQQDIRRLMDYLRRAEANGNEQREERDQNLPFSIH